MSNEAIQCGACSDEEVVRLPENKHLRRGLILVYAALGILGVWLIFKYALPWLLPFIIAFGISRLIEPVVRFLTTRFQFKRGFASAICTVITFAIIITLLGLLIGRIVYEFAALAKDLPSLLSDLSALFSAFRDKINIYVTTAPLEMQGFFQGTLDGFAEKSTGLLASLTGKLLGVLTSAASFSPKAILFIFTCAVGTFFISSGYKNVTSFLMRQLPRERHGAVRDLKSDFTGVLGKWVRAELMLSGVTFFELLAAFLIMRIEFAILLALLVAVIDVLPLLGVGSVLIPWAVVALISGDFSRAIMLAVTFGVIAVVRNILEPKLVGSQIGLPPIATLLVMYIGFCAAGIIGMALFPIGLIMLKHLNDRGIIKLWK